MNELDADSAQTIDRGPVPTIAGYRDFSFLGAGATSTVWRALQDDFGRWVAVKVLRPGHAEGPALAHFEREKRISAGLGGHPFIVQVFDTGRTADGRPFMAMDLCERGSLASRLEQQGTFTVDEVFDIGIKIASALDAAHRSGTLHRDIKPQNILLSQYGPALTDFGIARSTDASEWTESLLQLTVNHAAPETFLDTKPSAQSDIYSLGSTLFTMLAGQPPFSLRKGESSTQYLVRLEREPLPPLRRADVPPALRAVIERAMAKQPEDRFGSAKEFESALEGARGGGRELQPLPEPNPSSHGDSTIARPRQHVDAPVVSTRRALRTSTVDGVDGAQRSGNTTAFRARRALGSEPEDDSDHSSLGRARRRWRVAAGIGGVFVILVAVVTILNPSGDGSAPTTATTATTAGGHPTAPTTETPVSEEGTPVIDTLRDKGSTVTLTWSDTSGGRVVYFSIVKIDQSGASAPEVVTSVSKSDTHATITGLDTSTNYCFKVDALFEKPSRVGESATPTCTDRAT